MPSNYDDLGKVRSSTKELDKYIGSRVKFRRSILGISQEKLGTYLGVTFQQIQKYEKGTNRISSGVLYNISKILDVDFSYFVEGYNADKVLNDDSKPIYDIDNAQKKESTNLLKAYYKINELPIRKKILNLIKTFSGS
jgi:transcriptional regulator with XRE-family HTH domain